MRFPTDNTPPNQRRLAENDALVELIQTIEYLEDTPMWGQRDYWLYPPWYGDPFYRGRGRGKGRGGQEWLSERPLERSNGGLGRGFSHGNGRETRGDIHQAISERDQQDRWEEEWSLPTSERREEGILISENYHRGLPLLPLPQKIDFLLNWSSAGSPHVRTPPQSVPVVETEPNTNQPVNQTTQPGLEPTQIGVMRNSLQNDIIVSSPRTVNSLMN